MSSAGIWPEASIPRFSRGHTLLSQTDWRRVPCQQPPLCSHAVVGFSYRWLIYFSSWLHTPSTKTTPFRACEKYIRAVLTRLWRKCGTFVQQHPRADPEVSVGIKPSFIFSEICPSQPPHGGGNWIQYYWVGSRAIGEPILSACERLCRFKTSPTSRGVIRGCQENCCRHLENVWIKGFRNVAGTLYSPFKKNKIKKKKPLKYHVYSPREWCRSDWSRNDLSSWQTSERDERKEVCPAARLRRRGIALEIPTLWAVKTQHWPSVYTLRSRRDTHCVCNSAVLAWRVGS